MMLVVTGDFANTRIAQQRQQEDLLNSLRDRLQNLQNERRIQREFGARYARYREQGCSSATSVWAGWRQSSAQARI